MGIRRADFAGTWYPGTKRECVKMFEEFEREIPAVEEGYLGIGGIVPHAGWAYSGKTAFMLFHAVSLKKKPLLFFLFGRHLPPGSSDYIFIDEGFETPLGVIEADRKAGTMLAERFPFQREDARSFSKDNTIELQLPFIKYLFPEASVVVFGVSPTERALHIGELASSLSRELGTPSCFIGSTDLTHYGPNYGFMPKGTGATSVHWVKKENDRRIVELFLEADPSGVLMEAERSHNACCPGGAAAAISAARKTGADKGVLVNYTTSYDIYPNSSFVGYSAVVY